MKRRRQFIIIGPRDKIYFRVVMPALLVVIVACLAVVGYLFYKVNFPQVEAEDSPSKYLVKDVGEIQATDVDVWFLKGTPGAPPIFLCHDYGQNRFTLLNMASVINDQGYNVFVVLMRGHGSEGGGSTLGLKEGDDLVAAIDTSLAETNVPAERVAVCGIGLGAHAAIKAALQDKRIKVLILDSPYPAPSDLLDLQLQARTGFKNRLLRGVVGVVSALYSGRTPRALYEPVNTAALRDVSILFLAGQDDPDYRQWTMDMFASARVTKSFQWLPRSRRMLLDTPGWRAYDLKVTDFLKANYPLQAAPPAPKTPKGKT